MSENDTILFYDGSCALCQWWVKFVLARDGIGILKFAPLQGETFHKLLGARDEFPDSLLLRVRGGDVLMRSEAVIWLIRYVGMARLAALLKPIPWMLRDPVYNLVAATRHRLFGRTGELCPIVDTQAQKRFLP